MPSPNSTSCILLAIHPEFSDKIFDGTKCVEFRRRIPTGAVKHVVVYATAPVSMVVGWFAVDEIVSLSPQSLWRRFRTVGGINKGRYDEYYAGREIAHAYVVGELGRMKKPRSLESLGLGSAPPQSFQYLSASVAKRLGIRS